MTTPTCSCANCGNRRTSILGGCIVEPLIALVAHRMDVKLDDPRLLAFLDTFEVDAFWGSHLGPALDFVEAELTDHLSTAAREAAEVST